MPDTTPPPLTPAIVWAVVALAFLLLGFVTLWVWMITGGGCK